MWLNSKINYSKGTKSSLAILCITSLLFFASCKKDKEPEVKESFNFELPTHFPTPEYNFDENPVTEEGFNLGKKLFMDGSLSKDGSISCAHCHPTSYAFTQHGHVLSHGIDNKTTKRNSMPIQNLAWKPTFGWDGGVFNLDLFAVNPITNPVEMHEELGNVLEKIRNSKEYPKLFEDAFGSDEITTDHFLKALAQFQLYCISANSKFDNHKLGKAKLSDTEKEGMELFNSKCASCHTGVLQSDFSFRNNGLPVGNPNDFGREAITNNPADRYKFLVPSLRNLKFTYPYMHDGRFMTLEEVLDHYSEGIIPSNTLDSTLQNGASLGISLSESEKEKIIVFLNTLNDDKFVENKLIEVF